MSFQSISNLRLELVDILQQNNYVKPSHVQLQVIPKMLKGKKMIVESPSGSGKTLAFLIPIIQKLEMKDNTIQAIIITPTNELATQIYNVINIFSKKLVFKVYSTTMDFKPSLLTNPPKIIVGTPSKILSLYKNKKLPITKTRNIVIDEADMCIDLGFIKEIDELITKTNKLVLLHSFSATLPPKLQELLKKYTKGEVERITISNTSEGNNVIHYLQFCKEDINQSFVSLVNGNIFNPYMAIIFVHTKEQAEKVYMLLKQNKTIKVALISSKRDNKNRQKVIIDIHKNKFQYIVATDVASRGLDFEDLSHVIHLGLPYDLSYFVHRSGRTGRFHHKGESILFVEKKDIEKVREIERKFKITFKSNYFKSN